MTGISRAMTRGRQHLVRQRLGFSLIEMLTALTIMAIVSAIAIPKINTTQFRQDSGARTTRVALQIAARLAVSKQYDVIVSFDLGRDMIRIGEDRNNNALLDTGEPIKWRALEDGAVFEVPPAGVNGGVGAAVVGSSLQTVGGLPSIVFRRNGATSTDLEVYIGAGRGNVHDHRAVTVLQSTGRATWYRYAANGWKEAGL